MVPRGTVWNLIGGTLGATIAFLTARFIGGDWIAARAGGRLKNYLESPSQSTNDPAAQTVAISPATISTARANSSISHHSPPLGQNATPNAIPAITTETKASISSRAFLIGLKAASALSIGWRMEGPL